LSNKSTKYEAEGVVQKPRTISIMQGQQLLEAIHVLPQINTSAVVKKGNGTQKKTKVSP